MTCGRRGRLLRRGLVLADLSGLSLAFLGVAVLFSGDLSQRVGSGEYVAFVVSLPLWIGVAELHGLYDRDGTRPSHSTADDIVGVFHLVSIGAWILLVGSLLSGSAEPRLAKLITFWVLALVLLPLARGLARSACRRSAAYQQRAVIVGAGDVGQLLARKLVKHPEYGVEVMGFVDRRPKARRADLPEDLTILGDPEELREVIERCGADRVIISFSTEPAQDVLRVVRELSGLDVQVDVIPRLFELLGPRVDVHSVEGMALVGLPCTRLSSISMLAKRAFDVIATSLILLVVAPLFAYIAVRTRRDSPGPVFFRQTRLGAGMREFTALKFRTMADGTDSSLHRDYIRRIMSADAAADSGIYKLDRQDVITPFGRWLRRTSLDELPQLINVLRGDMSLVGPRPCIPYETEHFRPHQFERFLVPQGLTGLWQVTARANSTFGEALDMDVAYVRGWSLWLDLRLMLRTPFELLRQRTATA